MNKLMGLFVFSAGVAVGYAVSWRYLKDKYEQLAQEEIDSVKEKFSHRKQVVQKEDESEDEVTEPDTKEYATKVSELGYTNYSNIEKQETKGSEPVKENRPYVITPEEFDEIDGYGIESLTYYADGVLTTDGDEVLEDAEIDYLIGTDSLTHFGEYEDDSVFVRNDTTKCDYEILRDVRNYTDVKKRVQPPRMEG